MPCLPGPYFYGSISMRVGVWFLNRQAKSFPRTAFSCRPHALRRSPPFAHYGQTAFQTEWAFSTSLTPLPPLFTPHTEKPFMFLRLIPHVAIVVWLPASVRVNSLGSSGGVHNQTSLLMLGVNMDASSCHSLFSPSTIPFRNG